MTEGRPLKWVKAIHIISERHYSNQSGVQTGEVHKEEGPRHERMNRDSLAAIKTVFVVVEKGGGEEAEQNGIVLGRSTGEGSD